jgi:hypothetical protein
MRVSSSQIDMIISSGGRASRNTSHQYLHLSISSPAAAVVSGSQTALPVTGSAWGAGLTGIVKTNADPAPSSDVAVRSPRISRAMLRAITSPSPLPPYLRVVRAESACMGGCNVALQTDGKAPPGVEPAS